MIASKKKRSLICPTDVGLGALSLKVKYSISIISSGFSNKIYHHKRDWTYQTIQSESELLNAGGELAIFPALWTGILDLRGLLVFSETRDQGCIHLGWKYT